MSSTADRRGSSSSSTDGSGAAVDRWDLDRQFVRLSRELAAVPADGEAAVRLRLERAQMALALGRYEEALSDARWVASVDEHSADAFACVGAANAALMRYEDARLALDAAVTLNPVHREYRTALASANKLLETVGQATRLGRELPQSSEWWYLGAHRLRGWLDDYRPVVLVLISLTNNGDLLAEHVVPDVRSPSLVPPEVMAEFLSVSVESRALRRRPAHIVLQTASLARTFGAVLTPSGVSCRNLTALPELRRPRVLATVHRLLAGLAGRLSASLGALTPFLCRRAGLIDHESAGVTREVFAACAGVLQADPWAVLSVGDAVAVRLPRVMSEQVFVTLVVADTEAGSCTLGVRVFTSELDFQHQSTDAAPDNRVLAGEVVGVMFVPERYASFSDVDAAEEMHLPLASHRTAHCYPLFWTGEWLPTFSLRSAAPAPPMPSARKLLWLAAAMRVLAALPARLVYPTEQVRCLVQDTVAVGMLESNLLETHPLEARLWENGGDMTLEIPIYSGQATARVSCPALVVDPLTAPLRLPAPWVTDADREARAHEARLRLAQPAAAVPPSTPAEAAATRVLQALAATTVTPAERASMVRDAVDSHPDAMLLQAECATRGREALELVLRALHVATNLYDQACALGVVTPLSPVTAATSRPAWRSPGPRPSSVGSAPSAAAAGSPRSPVTSPSATPYSSAGPAPPLAVPPGSPQGSGGAVQRFPSVGSMRSAASAGSGSGSAGAVGRGAGAAAASGSPLRPGSVASLVSLSPSVSRLVASPGLRRSVSFASSAGAGTARGSPRSPALASAPADAAALLPSSAHVDPLPNASFAQLHQLVPNTPPSVLRFAASLRSPADVAGRAISPLRAGSPLPGSASSLSLLPSSARTAYLRAVQAALRLLLLMRRPTAAAALALSVFNRNVVDTRSVAAETAVALLTAGLYRELVAVCARLTPVAHPTEMRYGLALALFAQQDDTPAARDALVQAALANQHPLTSALVLEPELRRRAVHEDVGQWLGASVRCARAAADYALWGEWLRQAYQRVPGASAWLTEFVRLRGAGFADSESAQAAVRRAEQEAQQRQGPCTRTGCGPLGDRPVPCAECGRAQYCSERCLRSDRRVHGAVCARTFPAAV